MPADGHPAVPGPEQAAPAPQGGSSLLTADLPPPAPPPQPGTAEHAVQEVQNAPPEWAIPKYWNAERYKADPQGYLQEYAQTVSKSYVHAEGLLGGERIPVPKSDDDEDGWNRWYAATGRPDAPDKYEFKRPELPPDLPYDEEEEKFFRNLAHQAGLSKKQTARIYDGVVARRLQGHGAYVTSEKQARAQTEADLRREHGQQYEGFVSQAKTAIVEFTDPDFRAYLDQTGLGNDPRMIRVFGRVGKALTGDTKLRGSVAPAMTTADAKTAIEQFRAKNAEALYNRDHPQHASVVNESKRLYELAYPEGGA